MKCCTWSRVGTGPQAPAVGLDDGPADRQSHAGALRLGSEECIENLLDLVWWNSNSGIHDRNQELTAVIFCDLIVSLPGVFMLFMASIPLSMRFIKTCCNCTRSAFIEASSSERSLWIKIECLDASPRSKAI